MGQAPLELSPGAGQGACRDQALATPAPHLQRVCHPLLGLWQLLRELCQVARVRERGQPLLQCGRRQDAGQARPWGFAWLHLRGCRSQHACERLRIRHASCRA